MSEDNSGRSENRTSDIQSLERRISDLQDDINRRALRFTRLQDESHALWNVHRHLDASHRRTKACIAECEAQLRQLRVQTPARAAARRSTIEDLKEREAHQDWPESAHTQQVTDFAKQTHAAEQRLERTQLRAREQLRRIATAHAQRLETMSAHCQSNYEQVQRSIAVMRASLEEARRRLAQSRHDLVAAQSRES